MTSSTAQVNTGPISTGAYNLVPLNNNSHKNLKIRRDFSFPHSKSQQLVPVIPNEIIKAASCYPVCFIKDKQTQHFKLAAILGTDSGENLFYSPAGWNAPYIPLHIQKSPFAIATREDGSCLVAIDTQSQYCSEQEGESLFGARGEETPALTGIRELCEHLVQQEQLAINFINHINDLGLLTQHKLRYSLPSGEKKELTGLYSVDEELLKSLPGDQLLSLYKKGYLKLIHAHLMSLGQFSRLFHLKKS
ncbi:SapC family protein [Thalassomonas sp. RHCl1]|uniref:SapC family protein n=1 Tax=Thalassomonas sp. RHCl1 TaxID=2995320 RepID=UPI00248CDBA5|nr:SapC family protein [Thalassomonas sp. RHCl1]